MSNLGMYQSMTTLAKKLGGPGNLAVAIAVGGYVGLRSVEGFIKKGVKKIKASKHQKAIETSILYTASKEGTSNEGLHFNIGDTFHVLEQDGNAILIEKIGDTNNPYFVAFDFLKSISDYQ